MTEWSWQGPHTGMSPTRSRGQRPGARRRHMKRLPKKQHRRNRRQGYGIGPLLLPLLLVVVLC